jgi:fluoroquinolone transport system permease protein
LIAGAMRTVRALGPIDAKSVLRDRMLRWLLVFPLLIGVVVRWGVPALTARVQTRYGLDLTPYLPLVMSFVLLTVPTITGVVVGFLLLDERDDRTLTALQVTPLTLGGYLAYRISLPTVLSVVMTMLVMPLAGLVEMDVGPLVAVAVAAAPQAPLYAVFLAACAANKVQGFALLKAAGVLAWPPMFAYFIAPPRQWAFGVVPQYWPVKLFWMLDAGEPHAWLFLAAGLGYQAGLIALLIRRLNVVLHR